MVTIAIIVILSWFEYGFITFPTSISDDFEKCLDSEMINEIERETRHSLAFWIAPSEQTSNISKERQCKRITGGGGNKSEKKLTQCVYCVGRIVIVRKFGRRSSNSTQALWYFIYNLGTETASTIPKRSNTVAPTKSGSNASGRRNMTEIGFHSIRYSNINNANETIF